MPGNQFTCNKMSSKYPSRKSFVASAFLSHPPVTKNDGFFCARMMNLLSRDCPKRFDGHHNF